MKHDALELDVQRLLRAEADFPAEPAARHERVLAGVQRAIGAPAGAVPVGSRPLPGMAIVLLLGAVGLIAALLAWSHGDARRSAEAPRANERALVSPRASAPPAPRGHVVISTPPAPVVAVSVTPESSASVPSARTTPRRRAGTPSAPRSRAVTTAVDAPTSDLAAERRLVDAARAALARGDHDGALAAIARHELAHPRGQLAEEREALRIMTLARGRRLEEAALRASAFRTAHPDSPLLAPIDAALPAAP